MCAMPGCDLDLERTPEGARICPRCDRSRCPRCHTVERTGGLPRCQNCGTNMSTTGR